MKQSLQIALLLLPPSSPGEQADTHAVDAATCYLAAISEMLVE